MAITSYDLVTVSSEGITADIIVWRRYRTRATGMLEALLDANPHLSLLHKNSPFIPVGTQIRIPIDPDIMAGRPQPKTTVMMWGTHVYKP